MFLEGLKFHLERKWQWLFCSSFEKSRNVGNLLVPLSSPKLNYLDSGGDTKSEMNQKKDKLSFDFHNHKTNPLVVH